jgi:hypothetical protein
LRAISGGDYGPDADAWWRDPPKNLLFAHLGQTTLKIGVPVLYALAAFALLVTGYEFRRPRIGEPAVAFILAAGFMAIATTAIQLIGTTSTCSFGPSQITYYAEHGRVVGLEDARVGGPLLWIGLISVWMIGGISLLIGCAVVIMRSKPSTPEPLEVG